MSSTGGGEGGGAEGGGGGGNGEDLTDFQYFQAIETTFLLHRGAPLLLSPSDYQVARRWHRDGVPLDLVLRKLEEFFERHGEREDPKKVWSLRQCRPLVDAAWKNLRELTAPGERGAEAEPLELAPRLAALARALPAGLPGREELAGRIEALAGTGDPRAAEERLGVLEDEVVDALLAALAPDERAALEDEVEAGLAALADRVPREEAERARVRLLRQRVRRKAGLPTLSLFAPEAQQGD
jgi:hypothetical protein